MNTFDAAVYFVAAVAVIAGFNAGLIRSAATILGYLCAMPIAAATAPLIAPVLANQTHAPWTQGPFVLFGIFVLGGMVIGHLFRFAVSETIGPTIGIVDRLA